MDIFFNEIKSIKRLKNDLKKKLKNKNKKTHKKTSDGPRFRSAKKGIM